MERERFQHESFGQIHFSRVSGKSNFYGSELEQTHYVSMEVNPSEIERDLTQDWYFTRGIPHIRLRMTSGQFSELITSIHNGCGIPCTIEYLGEKKMQQLPLQESRKEFVHRKFQERMKMFADSIRKKQLEAKALIKKKSLSKQDMQSLQFHIEWLTTEIEKNIPFFAECFQETIDEVVFEAKMEIENAIQHKINVLGLQKLKESQAHTKRLRKSK